MIHVIRLGVVAGLLLVTACGGGGESEAAAETGPPATAGAEQAAPEPAATNPGTAGQGDPCDFGGATHRTCGGGLHCCYPETGEVEYGTCTASCPGYE